MNGNNNQKPRMTREEYERLKALRDNSRKIKQRKDTVISIVCLVSVVLSTVLTLRLLSPIFGTENYPDVKEAQKMDVPNRRPTDLSAPPEDKTPEDTESKVSFIAVGDNLIHEAVYTDAKNRAGGNGYNFIDMYDGVADIIKDADVAYVNQETINAGERFGISAYPYFNTPQEAGDTLMDLGFDVVNLASNHMLDKGTDALKASFDYWKSKNATVIGAYTEEDFDDIRVQEVNGIKIAWISFVYGINEGRTVDEGSDIVIPLINESDIRRQTDRAKRAGDIVIASMHWGMDSSLKVTDSQKEYAKVLADCGVDVIIGTHSHTLQPVEWITSSDGTHKTLCYYSLGNLISTMHQYYNMVGGIATFDIVKKGDEVTLENVGVIPTMCHYSYDRDDLEIYTLENYSEELAQSHGSQLKAAQYGDFDYSTLKKLATTAVSKEFLPSFYN